MVHRHGRVRLHRRHVPLLFRAPGRGQDYSRGRLHFRLPSRPEAILEALLTLRKKLDTQQPARTFFKKEEPREANAPCRSRRKCLSNKPFPTVLLRSIFYHFFSMPSLESQIKTAADNAQNRFGKDVITDRYEFRGDITLTVARHAVADVVRWLRDSAGFDMMVNLCSVDNMGKVPALKSIIR